MDKIHENRKAKLGLLKKQYRYWSAINALLGWEATNPRFSRIYAGVIRTDSQKPYLLGEKTARQLEESLKLPYGWMDTAPTYADLNGMPDPKAEVLKVMESIPQHKWELAINLLKTLATDSARDDNTEEAAQSINSAKFG